MAVKSPPKTSSSSTFKQALNDDAVAFINRVKFDYPQFNFKPGAHEHWSSRLRTITYDLDQDRLHLQYGLLHELAHGLLNHSIYHSDFELLRMEAEAWELAVKLAGKYEVIIDREHIQSCLDTYRDWLHCRSACPSCGTHAMQQDSFSYHCFNCQTAWRVSSGRFVRPYRMTIKEKSAKA